MTTFPTRWKQRNIKKTDVGQSVNNGFSRILINILAARGIISREDIVSFLNPNLSQLHDPFLLPGMEDAVERLKEAVRGRENIMIFGDYDADGVISTALIFNFLRDLELDIKPYIPDRFLEGYDLGIDFFKKISAEKKYSLLMCVDCGTNSSEVMEFLKENNGPDVIVCDHHNQSADLDKSRKDYIIINPKVKYSGYPYKYLSGAGVTFKLIIAFLRKLESEYKKRFAKDYLTGLLDLVAVSIISDMMPLTGEIRVMVKKGLELIKKNKNPGLIEMIDTLVRDRENVGEYDLGFVIAPRLNAAGRIRNADRSFELLSCREEDKCRILDDLNSFNEERQNMQKDTLEEIIEKNDFDKIVKEKRIFIGKSKKWNEGVLGIVASDLVKKFNIPVILFREIQGKLKGSGRSADYFNLYDSLLSLSELFDNFGGHKAACGIRMKLENFNAFNDRMLTIAHEKISDEDTKKKFLYDMEIDFTDINEKVTGELEMLKPFGMGNPEPNFITKDCFIINFRYLKDGKHVKLKLENSGEALDAVMFNISEEAAGKIKMDNKVSILYRIRKDKWSELDAIQLIISDLF